MAHLENSLSKKWASNVIKCLALRRSKGTAAHAYFTNAPVGQFGIDTTEQQILKHNYAPSQFIYLTGKEPLDPNSSRISSLALIRFEAPPSINPWKSIEQCPPKMNRSVRYTLVSSVGRVLANGRESHIIAFLWGLLPSFKETCPHAPLTKEIFLCLLLT